MAYGLYLYQGVVGPASKAPRSRMFLTIPKYLHTCMAKESKNVQGTNLVVSDEIVISGISGRFPQAENMNKFRNKLMDGSDMTSLQTRFTFGSKLTPRMGLLENMNKFDADFFGLSKAKVFCMDPAVRKLIEVIYETILDAGINPESLRGSRTAVIIGTNGQNTGTYWLLKHGTEELRGHSRIEQLACFQANYVSHALDLRGTSFALGAACSTSCFAIETAVNSILGGKCDRAIVGATCLHHLSHENEDLTAIGATSPDGVCRAFDKAANGLVRAEAVVGILLERENLSKRKYATVKGIATNSNGYMAEGIFHPSGQSQENLYQELYTKLAIDPASVSYIEAHGTGTIAGDSQELTGLCRYFASAPGRIRPLLIGSLKTNMGHAEAASGICSVAKIMICAQQRKIIPCVNFNQPSEISAQLFEGSVKVVTEPEPLSHNLIGINSFGLGGTNGHLILELDGNNKNRQDVNRNEPNTFHMPLVVPFSGQSETDVRDSLSSALNSLSSFEGAQTPAPDQEFCGLLHQIYAQPIVGHNYRGYGIIKGSSGLREGNKVLVADAKVAEVDSSLSQRQTWFVFSGIGSQWVGMGKELLQIDAFHSSIQKSKMTLKNLGLNIEDSLFSSSMFSNVSHATTGIAAIQIALYDTFSACGVHPNGLIGYSSGEIVAAYADGCISAEEAIQISHACGRFLEEAKDETMPRKMANVGLSPEGVQNKCLSDVDVACHNSLNNVTISGSQIAVDRFLSELETEGIFCKHVNTCNVAVHCPNQRFCTDRYAKYIDDIVDSRTFGPSRNWISSCIPKLTWQNAEAEGRLKISDYFSFNLANRVLFYEALQHVPQDAVCIEIAPQGLLQSILKSVLPEECTILSPIDYKHKEQLEHFFSSIGDLYNSGVNFDISSLYPPVNFPVAARTPSVSSLVRWNHEKDWVVPIVENSLKYVDGIMNIDLNDTMYNFLEGHMLGTRIIAPAAQYLYFAWKSLAASLSIDYTNLQVTFKDLVLERAVFLNHDNITQLRFFIHKGTGLFEITENSMTVIRGKIHGVLAPPTVFTMAPKRLNTETDVLEAKDYYKLLGLAGYNFQNYFQSLKRMHIGGEWGEVIWKENWTTYIDSVLQASLTDIPSKVPEVPTSIETFVINPKELQHFIEASNDRSPTIPVINCKVKHTASAPGIKIGKIVTNTIHNRVIEQNIVNTSYTFVPYVKLGNSLIDQSSNWKHRTLAAVLDIVFENVLENEICITYICSQSDLFILPILSTIIGNHPVKNATLATISTSETVEQIREKNDSTLDPCTLNTIVCRNSVEDVTTLNQDAQIVVTDSVTVLKNAENSADASCWMLFYSNNSQASDVKAFLSHSRFIVVAEHSHETQTLLLIRKKQELALENIVSLSVDSQGFGWVPQLQNLLSKECVSRVFIYSQNNVRSGIVGLTNNIKREINGHKIRCIYDPQGELKINFSEPCVLLQDFILKDLVMNVYFGGTNGTFGFIPLPKNLSTQQTCDAQYAQVSIPEVETLDNLRWIESPIKLESVQNNNKVYNVKYASLNFKDLMLATGKLTEKSTTGLSKQIGVEFSGTDKNGVRVMGMAENALATHVLDSRNTMILNIPPNWTFEEAATVPAAYFTAYHAFMQRVKLEPYSTVLIHSGTGALGQAAINLALRKKCTVFTSVGSDNKRSYIKQLFPNISDSCICSSQDCSFEDQILEATNGQGVDYVLNSLAGDKLLSSLNCTAPGGKFLEIGKFDIHSGTQLSMHNFKKAIEIHGVDLKPIFYEQIGGKKELLNLVRNGISNGTVKPLQYTVFPHNYLQNAFRHMASRKHVGKIIIQIRDDLQTSRLSGTSRQEECNRIKNTGKMTYFDPQKVYVIIGGLGGFGMELADWVIKKGAQNLVLVSRSHVNTGYQKHQILSWLKQGVQVTISNADLTNFAAAKLFIRSLAQRFNGVGGIFNLGMVLQDAAFINQTKEMFKEAARPKICITHNLDIVTRMFCPSLEYFTAFSSVISGIGNKGVTNYGLANSGMEQICFMRRRAGLHALAIQWGVIGEAGHAAERMSSFKFFKLSPQTMANCLQALDEFLIESKGDDISSKECLSTMVVGEANVKHQKLQKRTLTSQICELCSIKIPVKNIDPSKSLSDLGLDSLSGAEMQQILNRDYNYAVNIARVMSLTWGEVQEIEEENNKTGNEDISILNKLESKCCIIGSNPIFIVHGADGLAGNFKELALLVTSDVYAFQTVQDDNNAQKIESMSCEAIATYYIKYIKKVQPRGPYNISGCSGGGVIALEIARQLEFMHHELVDNLIMLDAFCFYKDGLEEINLRSPMMFLTCFLDDTFCLSPDEKKMILDNIHPTSAEENKELIWNFLDQKLQGNGISDFQRQFCKRAITLAMKCFAYKPSENFKIKARLHLIKTRHLKYDVDTKGCYYFQQFCEYPVVESTVNGDHFSFLHPGNVEATSEIVNNILLFQKQQVCLN